MGNYHYSSAKNILILIRLMKEHGIKKVVVSPGATDYAFVASLQHDKFFELYSSIDERSAAYIATGLAAETGEPVAITCTGATSSRNYMPGLTEAYYRHLPILAITCSRSNANVGHLVDQVTDRGQLPADVAKIGVYLQAVATQEDEWDCAVKANKAILELSRAGGGPSHINLCCTGPGTVDLIAKELPNVKVIRRYSPQDCWPKIVCGKIGIFVGAHQRWDDKLTKSVDEFCEKYNAVVLCDQTSNYKGKYGVLFPILTDQYGDSEIMNELDLMIHIGYVSTAVMKGKEIWRVNPDGEIRDTFKKLTSVFECKEEDFFEKYNEECSSNGDTDYYKLWKDRYCEKINNIENLPFSNVWCASVLSQKLPISSIIHFGIRNSLRSWNYFEVDKSILCYCNTGGFGIDGGMSSLIGASFADRNKIYYGVFGDLLFYYDMNSLGNRDIQPNVRIMIINNGLGQEFKNYTCPTSNFGVNTDKYVAAKGHFNNNQGNVIKNYVESLGFEYLSAQNKEEFIQVMQHFTNPTLTERPMLLEVKVTSDDECKAHEIMTTLSGKSKILKKGKDILSIPELAKVKSVLKKHM